MSTPQAAAWLLATALLAGCPRTHADDATAAAAAPAQVATTPPADAASATPTDAAAESARVPGLPGLSGSSGLGSHAGRYAAPPKAIAEFVLALPTRDLLASRELRQRWLATSTAYVVDIARPGGEPDHLVIDKNTPDFDVWVRSFRGTAPDTTGYIVQARVRCSDLADPTLQDAMPEARAACAGADVEYADSGLRAYRQVAGQAPEDVTATIANPVAALGRAALERYASMGASGPSLDASRLDREPVFRWTIESDPEHPQPASDPRALDGGAALHAGFVVWNGDRFENRDAVTATQWPCPKDAPSQCAERDRFVTPGK